MAEIVLEHVTKRFPDGTLAVTDVNLEIADGEFVILVGPSGCGKSTTLNMIAGPRGHHRRRAAHRRQGGQRQGAEGPRHRDGVPELRALPAHDRAREHGVRPEAGQGRPRPTINEKVDEAAEILDLTEHLDRKPANLSGGQRQRVAMGRAIVRDPEAFLMDEPLSNLDAKLRVQMRTEVSRLQKRLGTTTVYVTHDQTEAMTLGRPGGRHAQRRRSSRSAPPQELYDNPRQPLRRRLHRLAVDELPAGDARGRHAAHPLGDIPLTDRDAREVEEQRRRARGDRRHPARGTSRTPRWCDRRTRPHGHVHRHRRRPGVDGLRHVRLLHARRGAGGAPSSRSWRRDAGTGRHRSEGDQIVARLEPRPSKEAETKAQDVVRRPATSTSSTRRDRQRNLDGAR